MRLSMVKISFKVKGVHQDENTEVQIAPSPPPPCQKKKRNTAKRICQGHATFHVKLPLCK